MSKNKNKFDLTHLVRDGLLHNNQTLFFVSNPNQKCIVTKQPNGDYKVLHNKDMLTLHAFVQKCLEQEPPTHASMWVRVEDGTSLYDLWHGNFLADAA